MKFPALTSVTLLAASLLSAPALADPGAKLLADVHLKDVKDRDVVRLPACTRGSTNMPVTSLGLRVTKHPAEIDRLVVSFYNGEKQELSVRHRFAPGSTTRWIDLSGSARCIRSIRILGDTDSVGFRPGKQARVAFWGKTGGGGGAVRGPGQAHPGKAPPMKAHTGGADTGRMGSVRLRDAKDWDALVLPPCASSRNEPVSRLKIRVNDHPAEINHLVVQFHNGGKQEIHVRKQFAAGSESVWHDLRGPARCISNIRIVGDTQSLGWRPGKQAEVVFWGKS